MKRKIVLILGLLGFLAFLPLPYAVRESFEVEASVLGSVHNISSGQNYTTIQEAINDASYGDVIAVDAGIYNEDVVANQSVSLIGEDRDITIVNGSGTAPVFKVTSGDVEIINFTIQNNNFVYSGVYVYDYRQGINVSHNLIRNCSKGVWLWDYSENNFVVENEILNCTIGVKDWYSSGNFIIGNNISFCSEYGVDVEGSDDTIVQGNTITDCWGGIYLSFGARRTVINDNYISNGDGGIGLDASSYNTITNNRVEYCEFYGIYLGEALYTESKYNTVTNNTISFSTQGDGLFIYSSTANNLSDNTMLNNLYNFRVEGEELSDFINFIDTSNTVDGKPIYYWLHQKNVAVPLDAGYVGLVNCTDITVQNLNLTKNGQGVLMAYTANSTILGNNIENNDYGMHFCGSSSQNNIVHENNITENVYGVYFLDSSNNTFHHNRFIDNTNQVSIEAWEVNTWDDGYPSGGNYWGDFEQLYPEVEDIYSGPYQNETGSDGFWDEPYVINEDNQDNYPIVPEFPSFLILPLFMLATLLTVVVYRRKHCM